VNIALSGYEFKVRKFNRQANTLSLEAFSNGIGQALLYLRFGIQQPVLILGFHSAEKV
jgi:hypothetical protein